MATQDKYGIEVTPDRWGMVDAAIASFVRKYPLHWNQFKADLSANRTEYGLAKEGDLKGSSFRNTLSFPVVGRKKTDEETAEDPGGRPYELLESLKDTLEAIIPGFTDNDGGVSKKDVQAGRAVTPNKLYREFVRRYGRSFSPGDKV